MSKNVFNRVAERINDFMLPEGTRVSVATSYAPDREHAIATKRNYGYIWATRTEGNYKGIKGIYHPSNVTILDSVPVRLRKAVRNTTFVERFRGKAAYAQPAETNKGEWRAYLDPDEKIGLKAWSIFKGAALVGAAVVVGFGAFPMLAATGIAFATASIFQGMIRSSAEEKMNASAPTVGKHVKDSLKYLTHLL